MGRKVHLAAGFWKCWCLSLTTFMGPCHQWPTSYRLALSCSAHVALCRLPCYRSGRQNSRASAYSLWGPMPDPLSCLIYYYTSFLAAASHFLKFKSEPRVCLPAPPAVLSSSEMIPVSALPEAWSAGTNIFFFHMAQFLLGKPSPQISSPSPSPPQAFHISNVS